MSTCINCNKETQQYHNYCDGWECPVAFAKKNGGKEFLPNGLPIRCIRWDYAMFECEGGDHPDYKFPVTIEFVGEKDPLETYEYEYCDQTHALIYSDGFVALTLHEATYVM